MSQQLIEQMARIKARRQQERASGWVVMPLEPIYEIGEIRPGCVRLSIHDGDKLHVREFVRGVNGFVFEVVDGDLQTEYVCTRLRPYGTPIYAAAHEYLPLLIKEEYEASRG